MPLPSCLRSAAVLLVVVVLAGCGSTVPLEAQGTLGAPQGATVTGDAGMTLGGATETPAASTGGAVAGATGGTAATAGGSGSTSVAAPGAAPAGATAAKSGGGGPQPGPASAGAPAGRGGSGGGGGAVPGLTRDKIYLGFQVTENGGAANAAIGAAGVSQGEPRTYLRIAVEDLNKRGGIAGRTVEPVIFAYDAQSAQSDEQQYQQACDFWTQDNEVFAVAAPGQGADSLRRCLTQRGVPQIGTGLTLQDARSMASYPLYSEVGTMNLHRMATNTVEGLAAQGYFAPEGPAQPAKVGVLRFDYPTFDRAYDEALEPALVAQGFDDVVEYSARVPSNSSDLGGTAADINAAILRFRQENVNHVLILETSATLAFLFMRSAESQTYRPQYGLHSQNGGQVLAGLVPPEQLRNAMGIGWLPQIDVRESDVPTNAAHDRCIALMRSKGASFPDQNAKGVALIYCDQVQFFRSVAKAAPSLTAAGFVQGVERLGTSFGSTMTFSTRFGRGRRDGAAAYRFNRFHADCACFKYASGTKPAR